MGDGARFAKMPFDPIEWRRLREQWLNKHQPEQDRRNREHRDPKKAMG